MLVKIREILWVILIAGMIVLGLDALTNSVNTQKNAWDFVYYIALAKDGFHAEPMASPFAYRYLTPFLVHTLTLLGMTINQGFGFIAYFGAIAQLTSIFLFVLWSTKSRKGAYLAMGITALSLYNIKFLLFDVYRPDHLAYPLILVQTYLAFKRRFTALLLTTIVASQIREFNIVPLIAYLFMIMRDDDRCLLMRQTAASMIFLIPSILLPRILIPVTERYQIIEFSKDGLVTALLLPLIPSVSVNFIFSIVAYLIPLLFLADLKLVFAAFTALPKFQQRYLMAYTFLVLLLSFYGGTDIFRFVTFLFLPLILLMGSIAPEISNTRIGFMLISMFVFNRIWLNFPDGDLEKYRDFYGGFSLRLNSLTFYRILECATILVFGRGIRQLQNKINRA